MGERGRGRRALIFCVIFDRFIFNMFFSLGQVYLVLFF